MEKFYEKSLYFYVFLKFHKKIVILEILQKLCWNPLKMTVLAIQCKNFTQYTVHLYFKKKLIFILPPNMSNFLLVCFISTLM
jgi:hypothetical protein